MISGADVAADYAARFARQLGSTEADAARVLMSTRPAELVEALDRLVVEGQREMLGAFAIGPTYGTPYLPEDPVEAMRGGKAHRVPLIVGTNADEGRLFTRFLKLLPTDERAIERMLAHVKPHARERILAAYPEYPRADACVRFGGDFIFGSAVWQIAQAHSAHAPTHVYRYDYATRALRWSGMGATHATELLAVFDVYRSRFGRLLAAGIDSRAAQKVSDDVQRRWLGFAAEGVPGSDWPRYSRDERAVLVLDHRRRVELDPHSERRMAWEDFSRLPARTPRFDSIRLPAGGEYGCVDGCRSPVIRPRRVHFPSTRSALTSSPQSPRSSVATAASNHDRDPGTRPRAGAGASPRSSWPNRVSRRSSRSRTPVLGPRAEPR